MFYIKYGKTFFPSLRSSGEEKKFDALFLGGVYALLARMRSGLLTTSLNTISGKCEKWQLCASHYITEHTASLAILGFTQYKMWQLWTPHYIAAMDPPGNILARLRLHQAYQTQTRIATLFTSDNLSARISMSTLNYTTHIGAHVYTEPRFIASLAVVCVKYYSVTMRCWLE